MPQLLKPAPLVVSASASFHADRASRLLLEKREQPASTELATQREDDRSHQHRGLKNALREVNTDRNKLGQGWLLSLKRQHPDEAPTQRREQEPSIPSIELAFAKLESILCHGSVRTISDYRNTIQRALRRFTLVECCRYLAAAGYDANDPT